MATRKYELMAVISPDVTEDLLEAAIERVGSNVTVVGGEISSSHRDSPWGRRRLAYPIRFNGRDVRDGFYVLYYFDLESTKIIELERELKLNDQVIRYMVIQQVAPAPQPFVPEEGATAEGGENAAAAPEAAGVGEAVEAEAVESAEPVVAEAAAEPEVSEAVESAGATAEAVETESES